MKLFSILIIALILTFSCYAKEGKPWHKPVYDSGCKNCHDKGTKNYPSDKICLSCHDLEQLVDKTSRQGDERWENPHNNLHYGKDVPCMECHGEHIQDKQPMCKDCHSFKFENYKG